MQSCDQLRRTLYSSCFAFNFDRSIWAGVDVVWVTPKGQSGWATPCWYEKQFLHDEGGDGQSEVRQECLWTMMLLTLRSVLRAGNRWKVVSEGCLCVRRWRVIHLTQRKKSAEVVRESDQDTFWVFQGHKNGRRPHSTVERLFPPASLGTPRGTSRRTWSRRRQEMWASVLRWLLLWPGPDKQMEE